MALAQQISVGPAGTVIAGPTTSGGGRVQLRNPQTTVSVYVGGNENQSGGAINLNSTNGYTLGPQAALALTQGPGDTIYVYASATVTVEVFRYIGSRID